MPKVVKNQILFREFQEPGYAGPNAMHPDPSDKLTHDGYVEIKWANKNFRAFQNSNGDVALVHTDGGVTHLDGTSGTINAGDGPAGVNAASGPGMGSVGMRKTESSLGEGIEFAKVLHKHNYKRTRTEVHNGSIHGSVRSHHYTHATGHKLVVNNNGKTVHVMTPAKQKIKSASELDSYLTKRQTHPAYRR